VTDSQSIEMRSEIMKNMSVIALSLALILTCFQPVLAGAKAADKRAAVDAMARETLDTLLAEDHGASKLYDQAAAYAVFDSLKISIGLSGGGGVGVAVDKASGERTYMKMGTAGIGLGLGGKSFQIIFLFESDKAYRNFIDHGWQAEASAGAAAGTAGKDVASSFTHGVAIFQLTNKGLIAQADVSGTKFWKAKKLNEE
jgi:lipid-binding SYLF domain-containing protein